MKFNHRKFFYIVPTAFFIFLLISIAHAQVINIRGNNSPLPTPTVQLNMLQEIKAGIDLLKSSPPLLYETTKKNLNGDLVRKQIAFAVLNKNTGEIFEKRVWVKESDIKNYKKTGVIDLTPAISSEPLDIYASWWNSFNSFFSVTDRPELIVIADKYLLASKDLYTLPERSKNKYTDIVYVPYSESLHLSEIVGAGKDYLGQKIDQAYAELDSRGVLSRSSPGSLVTSGIGKDFIKNIILVEHVDPSSFSVAEDGGLELTERVLALIGSNQSSAYRYTGSPAGAYGLAQFIKSSYSATVSAYPKAKLTKDFTLGMADHVNAIKAMVLFFDSRKKEITDKVKRTDILNSLGITEEMLAAAYNGGGTKVISSVNKFGMAWITSQLNVPSWKAILKPETINYLKKFQSIKGLKLFADISNG